MSAKKLEYLEQQLENRAKSTGKAKFGFKSNYKKISISLALLAALNTFLIAMSQYGSNPAPSFGVLALATAALLTVANAIEGTIKPRENFVQNADALNKVYDIQKRLEWRKLDETNPITEDEIDQFFMEFRKLEKSLFESTARTHLEDAPKPQNG